MQEPVLIPFDTFTPSPELVFICNGYVTRVPFQEIIRIEKCGFLVKVITASDSYPCKLSLEQLLRELPFNRFARVHKSHILSLEYLHLVDTLVPVTPYYKKLLTRKLARLLEQHYRNLYEPV